MTESRYTYLSRELLARVYRVLHTPASGNVVGDRVRTVLKQVENPTIGFLCHGNICRSPFAERFFEQEIPDSSVQVFSSGFYDEAGRPSPETAVKVAQSFEVDLANHKSEVLSPARVAEIDLIFLMDFGNYVQLRRRFPRRLDDAYFLGTLNDSSGPILADPYDGTESDFEACYSQIADSITSLRTILDE